MRASLLLLSALAGGASAAKIVGLDFSSAKVRKLQSDTLTPPVEFETTSTTTATTASSTGAAADVADELEADPQVTVIEIKLATLLCETLTDAVDAETLAFALSVDETITATNTYYELEDGDKFDDGIPRHTWLGYVTDPEQGADEAAPRTVSMTWGEPCTVETFFMKIVTEKTDGSVVVQKSVPCESEGEGVICFVEMEVEFAEEAEPLNPSTTSSLRRRLRASGLGNTLDGVLAHAKDRKLQADAGTVVNVMMLYSPLALSLLGDVAPGQIFSIILEALASTNEAFINSQIELRFAPSFIGQLPYTEEEPVNALDSLLDLRANSAVADMRDLYEADLVQLIGGFTDYCSFSWQYFAAEAYGFSVVNPTCIDNFSHTHAFGHQLGCFHDRENSGRITDYSHGWRPCTNNPFRTIMSAECTNSSVVRVNYFSTPNVTLYGFDLGAATEDNARTIEENMNVVAAYRPIPGVTDAPTSSPTVSPTGTPTTSPTVSPTTSPTVSPTTSPTVSPTTSPTVSPTNVPTGGPTTSPTVSPSTLSPPPTLPYVPVGCYADSPDPDRVLTGSSVLNQPDMTAERCADICQGSTYFGTQYGAECWCSGNSDVPTSGGPSEECTIPCTGDAGQICGGFYALSLYRVLTEQGCWTDSKDDRVLTADSTTSDSMTTELCASYCAGYPIFGTQFSNECFCGSETDDYTELGSSSACSMYCSGDDTAICGGRDALSVYEVPAVATPGPGFLGCFADVNNARIFVRATSDEPMTAEVCKTACVGSAYYGTQYGVECWCGDAAADYSQHGGSESCTIPCAGDPTETCGGRFAMSVYEI